jgi:hypothetical protein
MHKAGEPHTDVVNLVGHLHEFQTKVEAVSQSQQQLLQSIESVQAGGHYWAYRFIYKAPISRCFSRLSLCPSPASNLMAWSAQAWSVASKLLPALESSSV